MSSSCLGDKNYSLYNETQPKQVPSKIDKHGSVLDIRAFIRYPYSFVTTQLYQQVAQNIQYEMSGNLYKFYLQK